MTNARWFLLSLLTSSIVYPAVAVIRRGTYAAVLAEGSGQSTEAAITAKAAVEQLVDQKVGIEQAAVLDSGFEQALEVHSDAAVKQAALAAMVEMQASRYALENVIPTDLNDSLTSAEMYAVIQSQLAAEDAAERARQEERLAKKAAAQAKNKTGGEKEALEQDDLLLVEAHGEFTDSGDLEGELSAVAEERERGIAREIRMPGWQNADSAAASAPDANVPKDSRAYRAGFDEDGYLWVAKLDSTPDMAAYIRRVITKLNLEVRDEGGFFGLVPYYSGEKTMQTFYALTQELLALAGEEHSWVTETRSNDANLLSVTTALTGITAPLNERGYRALAAQNSDTAMTRFIRRTANDMGYRVVDEEKFKGTVPYYSGTVATQTFARLRQELIGTARQEDAWATNGATAVLSEAGYRRVCHMNSDGEMRKFVNRLAKRVGCQLTNNDQLLTDMSFYKSGAKNYRWLQKQVRNSCNVQAQPHYGPLHDVVGTAGVFQLRWENSTRHEDSTKKLFGAGIVPTPILVTSASDADEEQLRQSCPLKSDQEAALMCKQQGQELGIPDGLGSGCDSEVEQAMADSHRRALVLAQQRADSDWTVVLEENVVPLHPAAFGYSFKRLWEQVPTWAKMVRLSWCTSDQNLGAIRKETFADAAPYRLVANMSWYDAQAGQQRYYTGGCTTGYMVHRDILPELLNVFPCCCSMDCCMERQFFYAPTKPEKTEGKYRGEQILINMDAWDSKEVSYGRPDFTQAGVFVQDNSEVDSPRPL